MSQHSDMEIIEVPSEESDETGGGDPAAPGDDEADGPGEAHDGKQNYQHRGYKFLWDFVVYFAYENVIDGATQTQLQPKLLDRLKFCLICKVILCVWVVWSGSNNRVYMYHVFHWLAIKKFKKD